MSYQLCKAGMRLCGTRANVHVADTTLNFIKLRLDSFLNKIILYCVVCSTDIMFMNTIDDHATRSIHCFLQETTLFCGYNFTNMLNYIIFIALYDISVSTSKSLNASLQDSCKQYCMYCLVNFWYLVLSPKCNPFESAARGNVFPCSTHFRLSAAIAAVCCVGSARENKENMDDLSIQNVLVGSDGSCFWWTRIEQASSYCPLDVSWFPVDTQQCSLSFESWTMNSQEMNMTAMNPGVDLEKYKRSGEWDLIGERFYTSYMYKNSSVDEIANVNFYALRPEDTRIRKNNAK